jgi:hypothetical protein
MARSVKIEAKQRRHGLDHFGLAAHVQEALMLPRKARGRQVFGGRRTAHRNCDPGAVFLLEPAICRGDLATQMSISGRRIDNFAGGRSTLRKKPHIVVIKIAEEPAQLA